MLSVDFNFMQAPKSKANPETAGSIAYNPSQESIFNTVETAGSIASNNTSSNSSSSSSFCAIA